MKKILLLLLLPIVANSQIITTFAGTGSNVFSGNGVAATTAGLPDPIGGAWDKYGNYYFADALGAHVVRKIDMLGIITTVAGNNMGGFSFDGIAATATKLYSPQAVKLDTFGNLFIADAQNARIRKVDKTTGIITTVVGTGVGAFGGDNGPATAAQIWNPQDICFDKLGNMYIAESFSYKVRKVDPSGIITTIAGSGFMSYLGDGGPATAADIYYPQGLAIDDTGNLYIAEGIGNRVRKINTAGIITTVAGNGTGTYTGDNIPATDAQINPVKVAIDTSGQLFIADAYNRRVFRVDHSGILHLVAGNGVSTYFGDGGPATAASLYYPGGVSFDPCGNLYIPEPNNRRVRKVDFNPTCTLPSLSTNSPLQKLGDVKIFPNPVAIELNITAADKITEVLLCSIVGQIVYRQVCFTNSLTLQLRHLPPGMYMVRVTDSGGNATVHKISKQ